MTEQMEGQMSIFDLDIWCGKMYQEHSVQTVEKTSELSLKKPQKWQKGMLAFLDLRAVNGPAQDVSWEMGGALLGEYTMRSFGEYPSEEKESRLSQILEAQPHPKYCLSAKACQGILRRAENRGKELPAMLKDALKRQALSDSIGNDVEAVTMDNAMPTLQAAAGESGNNQPMVCQTMEPIVLDTNQNDASIHQDGKCNTLPAAAGMGGGYVPMVALTTEITPKIDNDGVAFSLRSSDYKDPKSVCCFEPGAASRVGGHVYEDISGTVRANAGDNQQAVCYGIDQQGGKGMAGYAENVSPTMASDSHGTPHAVCYGISPYDSNGMKSDNPHAGIYKAETARTLDLNGGNPACNQGGIAVVSGGNVPMVMETYQKTTGSLCASGYDKLGTQEAANDMYVVQSSWNGSQVSPTLTANNAGGNQRMPDKDNFNAVITTSHGGFMVNADDSGIAHTLEATDHKDPQTVCYGLDRAAFNQGENAKYNFAVDEEKIGTQVAKGPGAVCSSGTPVVRRLTPLECERLQGYPDGWTDIGEWVDSTGKKHKDADSPRYKALGNSIALPFWSWMAGRMVRNLRPGCTMGSLFDGIGGFPLVYSRVGVEPVWASEIEEFPIAVTKIRFPEENNDGDMERH